MTSPALEVAPGAVVGRHHGRPTARHFGRPDLEYQAAVGSAAVLDRSHRGRLAVSGRAPVRMLAGVITNSVPPPPRPASSGLLAGRTAYSAVLIPKGRLVTDLVVAWRGTREDRHGLWLHLPGAGHAPLLAHLRRFLPPRFAFVDDVTDATGTLTVLGPGAAGLLEAALGIAPGEIAALDVGGCVLTGPVPDGLLIARLGEVRLPAFDILGDRTSLARLGPELVRLGAAPTGMGVFETLRIEAGRPEFGLDMDDRTIPTEAGIDARAIDHGKGCYTGQEVIVRIRDRGHVNRHLRGLLLGDAPTPAAAAPLYTGTRAKPVGQVTSAALSPAFGQTIALGFVRREVVPPAEVRLGGPDGPTVAVRALGENGWELQRGDLR